MPAYAVEPISQNKRTHAFQPGFRRYGVAFLLALAAILFAASAQAQTICHVSTTGIATNGGTSWSDATTLQSALKDKKPNSSGAYCTDIRVQQGTYKPGTARTESFAINRPLRLRGGYTGNADERGTDPGTTVLSGNLGSSRSYHVIVIGGVSLSQGNGNYSADASSANYTLIDGFTITAGQANNGSLTSAIHSGGGGLVCNGTGSGRSCNPALSNLVFDGNTAAFGGALFHLGGSGGSASPAISSTVFRNNTAVPFVGGVRDGSGGSGGAIYNSAQGASPGTSSPSIMSSTFTGNTANMGGAIYSDAEQGGAVSSPNISGSAFSGNKALTEGQGGAIYQSAGNGGTTELVITATSFTQNEASYSGGAIYGNGASGKSTISISDSSITANTTRTYSGGAIYLFASQGTSTLAVKGSTFSQNSSQEDGGAIYSDAGDANSHAGLDIANSTFVGNTARGTDAWGGVIYIHADGAGSTSTNRIRYATFADNKAANGQSILHNAFAPNLSTMDISGSIFWSTASGSALPHVVDNRLAQSSINTSIVQGGWSGTGSGNINQNPSLGPLQDNGGPTLTMLPASGSLAVDAMACMAGYSTDQRGIGRPQTNSASSTTPCDMGAVEVKPPPPKYGLTVQIASGQGTVSAAPAGTPGSVCTSASSPCTNTYDLTMPATVVTLTAAPQSGYAFTGWNGSCADIGGADNTALSAQVSMYEPVTCTASFGLLFIDPPTANLSGTHGSAWSVDFSAGGGVGPYAYSSSSLPGGFSFTPAGHLVVDGTVNAGSYPVTITAVDQNNASISREYTIDVVEAPVAAAITPVPTLSSWALILLSMLAGATGWWLRQRRAG